MSQQTSRPWLFCLLALLGLALLAGCSSNDQSSKKPGATNTPQSTPSAQTAITPSATARALTACSGQFSDILLPEGAVSVGSVTTLGATVSCQYRIHQDVKTVDEFFKHQMGQSGWTLLNDAPEGPNAMVQTYFKRLSFATITLSQHNQDPRTTDITIAVETSK